MQFDRLTAAITASTLLHFAGLYGLSSLPSGPAGGGTGSLIRSQGVGGTPMTVALQALPEKQALISDSGQGVVESEIAPVASTVTTTKPSKIEEPGNTPAAEAVGAKAILPAPYYYRTREVDVVAAPVSRIIPDSETMAAIKEPSAELVLELLINESGAVDKVTVVESKPEGAFDSLEAAAFENARFKPAVKEGNPVKSRIMFEVRYTTNPIEVTRVSPGQPPKPLQ